MAITNEVFIVTHRDGLAERSIKRSRNLKDAAEWAQRKAAKTGNTYWVRDLSQELFKNGKKIPRVVYVAVPRRRW